MPELEWNLTTSTTIALHFVEWLEVEGVGWWNFVDETGHDNERAWQTAEHAGWVQSVPVPARLGDSTSADPVVTAAGRDHLERIEKLRTNRAERAAACRQGLLLWIYNTSPAGTDGFIRDGEYQFYGTAFTEDELREAVRYLRDRNLLSGTGAMGGAVMRPGLTAAGIDVVERYNGDLRAAEDDRKRPVGGDTYQQHFHGTVTGQVAQGQNVQQVQHQGVDPETLAGMFSAMRDALKGVDDPGLRGNVEDDIAELEQAVADRDEQKIRKLGRRIMGFAGVLGSQAAATVVTTQTTHLLQLMGLS